MKLFRSRHIVEEVDIQFDKYMIVPTWMFWYESCSKCGINIDTLDDVIMVRAVSEGEFFSFCMKCWGEEDDTSRQRD